MPPGFLWHSCVYFLLSLELSLIFPLPQNQSYKPVFGLFAPCSESVLFSRNRHVGAGITKEVISTVSGSLKAPGSLKVLG